MREVGLNQFECAQQTWLAQRWHPTAMHACSKETKHHLINIARMDAVRPVFLVLSSVSSFQHADRMKLYPFIQTLAHPITFCSLLCFAMPVPVIVGGLFNS